jgi:hypothetical protein
MSKLPVYWFSYTKSSFYWTCDSHLGYLRQKLRPSQNIGFLKVARYCETTDTLTVKAFGNSDDYYFLLRLNINTSSLIWSLATMQTNRAKVLSGLCHVSSCVMWNSPRVWERLYFTLPGCWIFKQNFLTHLNTP